jgi:hypothetical protein
VDHLELAEHLVVLDQVVHQEVVDLQEHLELAEHLVVLDQVVHQEVVDLQEHLELAEHLVHQEINMQQHQPHILI